MKTPSRIKIHFSFLKQREKFSQFPFSFHPIEGETSTDFNPQKKNNRASSIPFKGGAGFRVYVKREMKIIYFGQRSGSRSRPIVAATEGCGLRGGGRERVSRAEWKFGNGWVSMNHQSTVTRSPRFYRFIGLVTALDCCPGDLTLFGLPLFSRTFDSPLPRLPAPPRLLFAHFPMRK